MLVTVFEEMVVFTGTVSSMSTRERGRLFEDLKSKHSLCFVTSLD